MPRYSVKHREDLLILSMAAFFEDRGMEGFTVMNGKRPRRQRKRLDSIIRQAVEIQKLKETK